MIIHLCVCYTDAQGCGGHGHGSEKGCDMGRVRDGGRIYLSSITFIVILRLFVSMAFLAQNSSMRYALRTSAKCCFSASCRATELETSPGNLLPWHPTRR